MYKIGEFSKITYLTIKTLRYYDEEGILPATEHLENGYRLYTNDDFKKAQRIVFLRELDFSIREIKDILANVETEEDLQYFFKEKQQATKVKIRKQKKLLKKLDTYLLPNLIKGENIMTYEMKIKEIEAVEVATIRFVGSYPTMGEYLGKIFKYVKSDAAGAPFVCYFDGEYKEEADMEVCVPISKHVSGTKEITVKVLPKITALTTIHNGSYDNLNQAYKAILDYARENNLELDTQPSREQYIKGPGMVLKGNPDNYITEIMLPIKQ